MTNKPTKKKNLVHTEIVKAISSKLRIRHSCLKHCVMTTNESLRVLRALINGETWCFRRLQLHSVSYVEFQVYSFEVCTTFKINLKSRFFKNRELYWSNHPQNSNLGGIVLFKNLGFESQWGRVKLFAFFFSLPFLFCP